MPTQVMQKLRLSLMGFRVVPDTQWIGGQPFEFHYEGDKVHITDKGGVTKIGSCSELLGAYLNDKKVDK